MMRQMHNPLSRAGAGKPSVASAGRVRTLLVFVFLLGGVAGLRLYALQVLGAEKWKAIADNQHSLSEEILPDRGEIYFREGETPYPAAVNREYQMLYVSPRDITDPGGVAEALSNITGISQDEIRRKFDDRSDPFEIVKKKLSDEESDRVRALGADGVGLVPEKYRYYPAGDLASQVVGFVSARDDGRGERGRYGIEASLDELLSGKPGSVVQARDAAGRWISTVDREFTSPVEGPGVVLTIDHVIQHEVERILRDAMEKHGADGGTVIVMEPSTGRVLAMASDPSFDPNEFAKEEDYSKFMNPAVSFSYEPGSVMKPITMAVGIEEGKVSPDTEYVDPCVVVEAGYAIKNAEEKCYGRSSMRKVLEESINTGVIFVERLVGNRRFAEYLDRFGFGTKTGIELPAELSGNTRNLTDPRRDIQFFTASFGQGISATPIQLVAAYGALANRGVLVRPRIVEKYVYDDGREDAVSTTEIRRVVSEETARELGNMLEDVVLYGHGKQAAVSGYRIGGKTGTAQVAKKGEKGYDDGLTIGSFVGYAPLDAPRFVVLVKIDNPKDVIWAESSAAPVFGDVMKFLLSYSKVEPTEKMSNHE